MPTVTCLWASRATVTGSARVVTRGCNAARPCWCSTNGPWDAWCRLRRTATCRRRRRPPKASYPRAVTSRNPRRRICRLECRRCLQARCRFPCERAAGTRERATECPLQALWRDLRLQEVSLRGAISRAGKSSSSIVVTGSIRTSRRSILPFFLFRSLRSRFQIPLQDARIRRM